MKFLRAQAQQGFSVLEVLIASYILVFAIAATAALLIGLMTQTMASRRATEAAALAARELETLRDAQYRAIASAPASMRTVGANSYTLERIVTVDDPAPNLKHIRVTVSWTLRGARSYAVETVYTSLRE